VKNGKVERHYTAELKNSKISEIQENCEKFAIPFGHYYPGPNANAGAAPAKAGAGGGAKPASAPAGGGAKAKK
jgi:hypothetical protein